MMTARTAAKVAAALLFLSGSGEASKVKYLATSLNGFGMRTGSKEPLGLPTLDGWSPQAIFTALNILKDEGDLDKLHEYQTGMQKKIQEKMKQTTEEFAFVQKQIDQSHREVHACGQHNGQAHPSLIAIQGIDDYASTLQVELDKLQQLQHQESMCKQRVALLGENATAARATLALHQSQIRAHASIALIQEVSKHRRLDPHSIQCRFTDRNTPIREHIKKYRDLFAKKMQDYGGASRGILSKFSSMNGGVSAPGGYGYQPAAGVSQVGGCGCGTCGCCGFQQPMLLQKEKVKTAQANLEKATCGQINRRNFCTTYGTCFLQMKEKLATHTRDAMGQETVAKQEYASLMQMQCVLNAFGEGDGKGMTVKEKVEACQEPVRDEDMAFLVTRKYPEPHPIPLNSCNDPVIYPGTTAFIQKYFQGKEDFHQKCTASCCKTA
eukprot:TRINITY_DN110841_c0_g1_i1.p1 TRINITY_DN110841_c0_g1~~TRINITY_DN110841_c0_g1_i1.p1  ORF type:complete len:438 (+),score=106.88 TRINITY_DN110841_c0_g1_i1:160-1473(+)